MTEKEVKTSEILESLSQLQSFCEVKFGTILEELHRLNDRVSKLEEMKKPIQEETQSNSVEGFSMPESGNSGYEMSDWFSSDSSQFETPVLQQPLVQVTSAIEDQPTREISPNVPKFKMFILGDASVGKTTFIKRHATGEYEKEHIPTNSVTQTILKFYTNFGPVILDIHELGGDVARINPPTGRLIGTDCAIIMFDLMNRESYKNLPEWHRTIVRVCENIPIVLVGNKVDSKDRKVPANMIVFHRRKNLQYYDVSAKSNYNFAKPFLWILRKLTGINDLRFVTQPFLTKPVLLPEEDNNW